MVAARYSLATIISNAVVPHARMKYLTLVGLNPLFKFCPRLSGMQPPRTEPRRIIMHNGSNNAFQTMGVSF